ncbi:hypothetical protein BH20ACT2_BH20ACT2_23600 [soil metagenome]
MRPTSKPTASLAVLIPVKSFAAAKLRLSPALDGPARAELARSMAGRVLAAAAPLPVAVVCDDPLVAAWAERLGAEVVWRPGRGLNPAVTDGVAHLSRRGHRQVIVAHADLPLARSLAWVADFDGVTLVPDRHGDGTNVAAVPTRAGFTFGYGAGSFARHRAEAVRLDLPLRVVREPRLGWDVDWPADLDLPEGLPVEPPVGARGT